MKIDGRRKEYFAVYEKWTGDPIFECNTYEEARIYCEEHDLTEETHMLCKHTKKTREVELGFFTSPHMGDEPIGVQIKDVDDPSFKSVVMSQSLMRAPQRRENNES